MVIIIGKATGANDFIDDEIEQIKEVFKTVTHDAENTMINIIATSGRPTSKGTGRIDTGDMIIGVNSRTDTEDDYSITTSFGWDSEDFERPYPIYQEGGFTHVPDGSWIPGMHALQDATTEAQTQIKNEVSRLK